MYRYTPRQSISLAVAAVPQIIVMEQKLPPVETPIGDRLHKIVRKSYILIVTCPPCFTDNETSDRGRKIRRIRTGRHVRLLVFRLILPID